MTQKDMFSKLKRRHRFYIWHCELQKRASDVNEEQGIVIQRSSPLVACPSLTKPLSCFKENPLSSLFYSFHYNCLYLENMHAYLRKYILMYGFMSGSQMFQKQTVFKNVYGWQSIAQSNSLDDAAHFLYGAALFWWR